MDMRRVGAGMFLGTTLLITNPASAAVPHVVQPGETLSGIAAANGLTTGSVAAFNGISADTYVVSGETLQIPATSEAPVSSATPAPATTPMAPAGLHPDAAAAWTAMADAARTEFGVELQSAGPLSGYRTYEQQSQLYDQFLAGTGAPANPPGTSSHELGLAVDVATPEMRSVIDQIGGAYGWSGTIPSEWWHVAWGGA